MTSKRPLFCESEENVTKSVIYFREAHGEFEDLQKAPSNINSVQGSIIVDGHGCEGITFRYVLYVATAPSGPRPPHC